MYYLRVIVALSSSLASGNKRAALMMMQPSLSCTPPGSLQYKRASPLPFPSLSSCSCHLSEATAYHGLHHGSQSFPWYALGSGKTNSAGIPIV